MPRYLEKLQPQITIKAILCESHDESDCGFVPKHHKHGYIQGLWRRSNTKELIGSKIGTFNHQFDVLAPDEEVNFIKFHKHKL